MSKKYCYLFTEGNAAMRELLGGTNNRKDGGVIIRQNGTLL